MQDDNVIMQHAFASFTQVNDVNPSSTTALWCDCLYVRLFGIKAPTKFLISAIICNICEHPWNQQVVSAVFKRTSLQHLAGASRLSSPRQLPVMVISHSFSNTHTHTQTQDPDPRTFAHPLLQLTHFHICTLAHVHTLLFSSPSLFNNTTSSLTSSKKCTTLSPSAGVVTLSYSGIQSNFLVQD